MCRHQGSNVFAQINCFIYLAIPSEPIVNNKEVAIITARSINNIVSYTHKDNKNNYTDYYGNLFSINYDIIPDCLFVDIRDIYPSAVCTIPYASINDKKPISINNMHKTNANKLLAFLTERHRNCVLDNDKIKKTMNN